MHIFRYNIIVGLKTLKVFHLVGPAKKSIQGSRALKNLREVKNLQTLIHTKVIWKKERLMDCLFMLRKLVIEALQIKPSWDFRCQQTLQLP